MRSAPLSIDFLLNRDASGERTTSTRAIPNDEERAFFFDIEHRRSASSSPEPTSSLPPCSVILSQLQAAFVPPPMELFAAAARNASNLSLLAAAASSSTARNTLQQPLQQSPVQGHRPYASAFYAPNNALQVPTPFVPMPLTAFNFNVPFALQPFTAMALPPATAATLSQSPAAAFYRARSNLVSLVPASAAASSSEAAHSSPTFGDSDSDWSSDSESSPRQGSDKKCRSDDTASSDLDYPSSSSRPSTSSSLLQSTRRLSGDNNNNNGDCTEVFHVLTEEQLELHRAELMENILSSENALAAMDEEEDPTRSKTYKRRQASPKQVAILEQIFMLEPIPSSMTKVKLSRMLGMTPKRVQIWFKNKRARQKKGKPRREPFTFHYSNHSRRTTIRVQHSNTTNNSATATTSV